LEIAIQLLPTSPTVLSPSVATIEVAKSANTLAHAGYNNPSLMAALYEVYFRGNFFKALTAAILK
ncbi:hypothetical protein J6590_028133, partial [Homalodisca vitripennis]